MNTKMNNTTIVVNGQTYVIPTNKVPELLSWLRINSVVVQTEKVNDPRQLLLEIQ